MPSLIDQVKQEANGRERDIFITVGGASPEWFTSKGSPCPHCGGNDRFAWEPKHNSFFCRQCFSEGSARDVVGNTAWLLHGAASVGNGAMQATVAKKIADHCGIKTKQRKKKTRETTNAWRLVNPSGWVECNIKIWCDLIPPTTLGTCKRANITYGRYRVGKELEISAILIPGVVPKDRTKPFDAESNCEIQHYEAQRYDRSKFELKWETISTKRGSDSKKKAVKQFDDTPIGLCGPWDEIADAKVIVKGEGHTDMLAANAILPEGWVAISNTNGSKAYADWIAKACIDKIVYVVHDHDRDGIAGAEKWSKGIGKYASECYNVLLPNEGDDIRSYLNGRTGAQFVAYLEANREVVEGELSEAEAAEAPVANEDIGDETFESRLKDIGMEIVHEHEDGSVDIHSAINRRSKTIRSISNMTYIDLVQLGGTSVVNLVAEPGTDKQAHQKSFTSVKRDMAQQAAERGPAESVRGIGVWQDHKDGRIMVVNSTSISTWDGAGLKLESRLRHGNDCYTLRGGVNWFDHDILAHHCAEAMDIDWRMEVIGQVIDHIKQWTWSMPDAPRLCAGLIGATVLQMIWPHRPHISITGPSDAGKSSLTEWICTTTDTKTPLLGGLSWRTTNSTAAGLLQSVDSSAKMILMDEFDKWHVKQRRSVLDLLRASSGGGASHRGTANSKSVSQSIRHMCWIAGIYDGIDDEADLNRVVSLQLQTPPKDRWLSWRKMEDPTTSELGLKMIAVAIVVANEAKRLQLDLQGFDSGGLVHNRVVRSLSVPTAFLAATMGYSDLEATGLMLDVVKNYGSNSQSDEITSQQDEYLTTILGMPIDLGHGEKATVTQLLTKEHYEMTDRYKHQMEAAGVALKKRDDGIYLFICRPRHDDLPATPRGLYSVLGSIVGATKSKQRIAGRVMSGVQLPIAYLEERFKIKFVLPESF